jgi:hypothetical protein
MIRLACAAIMLLCAGALAAAAVQQPQFWAVAGALALAGAGVVTTVGLDLTLANLRSQLPIPMILHCPACGLQHVDRPGTAVDGSPWGNPPHRSHLCQECGHTWRPADVFTTGVASIQTAGLGDSTAPTLLHDYAKVGLEMVRITTTVHGPDEWPAIPQLWLDCMHERNRLRAELTPPPGIPKGIGQVAAIKCTCLQIGGDHSFGCPVRTRP